MKFNIYFAQQHSLMVKFAFISPFGEVFFLSSQDKFLRDVFRIACVEIHFYFLLTYRHLV